MIRALDRTAYQPFLLLIGLASAMVLRAAVAGDDGSASLAACLVAAMALSGLALAAGFRPTGMSWSAIGIGILGGLVLIAGPGVLRLSQGFTWAPVAEGGFLGWSAAVTVASIAEEMFFRGVLFAAVERAAGLVAAALVSSVTFALIHVPLYGWHVLPLDFAVGLWLGGLRAITRGVTAPAIAHVMADVAAWWLA